MVIYCTDIQVQMMRVDLQQAVEIYKYSKWFRVAQVAP